MISISADLFKAEQIPCGSDFPEYNASLIWKLAPFYTIMFALLEPSITFAVPDMVLTLTFVKVKSRKYLLFRIIVCVVT